MEVQTLMECDAPDENSPNHVFNIVNDDCIYEIIRRLNNSKDFCNTAMVCQRFQTVTQSMFSHKTLVIADHYQKTSIYGKFGAFIFKQPMQSTGAIKKFIKNLYNYLSIFGKYIRTVKWIQMHSFPKEANVKICEMITRFCGESLTHFLIIGPTNITITPELKVLQRFELFHGTLDIFKPSHTLQYLRLTQLNRNSYHHIDLNFLNRNFPNLEEAHFGDFTALIQNTTWFSSFMEVNPQIKKLSLFTNEYFTNNVHRLIHDIGEHLSKLESLHLDLFPVNVEDLKGLEQLKCLRIPYSYMTEQQMNSLVSLNLPIEELEITLRTGDIRIAKRVSQLKNIKKLNLNVRFVKARPVSAIIENLPPLDDLNIQNVITMQNFYSLNKR